MKIEQLISGINGKKNIKDEQVDVTTLCLRAEECVSGSVFFCMKGNKHDGKDFIADAIKRGATLIVADCDCGKLPVDSFIVKDVRTALTVMCKNFYDNPQKKLRTIAVVGTNGKSSVCEMIYGIMNKGGIPCGSIGTLGVKYADKSFAQNMTTPDPPELYRILSDMVKSGVKVVCMELSAHGIFYKKAQFCFDFAIFTNCSRDHLDFFGNYDRYCNVKRKAFLYKNAKIAIVNGDDPVGRLISLTRERGVITYGIEEPADVFAIDVYQAENGVKFVMNLFDCLYEINSRLWGRFNVYNMLAAASVCALCGIKTEEIAYRLNSIAPVCGRMQRVANVLNVFIDYAHTPTALEEALSSINAIKGDARLICLFGCGGNRDEGKRRLMGAVSARLADFTIITSDNPRYEDEGLIMGQIEEGVRANTFQYITICDRKAAIEYAVNLAEKGDYLLIAGKGAERYQEKMGVRVPFSDEQIAREFVMGKYDKL